MLVGSPLLKLYSLAFVPLFHAKKIQQKVNRKGKANNGSISWQKWTISQPHSVIVNLRWLQQSKGEVLMRKVYFLYVCAQLPLICQASKCCRWLTYLGVIFPTRYKQLSLCWSKSACKWHYRPVVHVVNWTNNEEEMFPSLLVPPFKKRPHLALGPLCV